MGKVLAGMTMSLDGFVHDHNGDVSRLYPNLEALRNTQVLQDSIQTTGAVVMGRKAFAMGDPDLYAENYEYQVPIFVLTHHIPEKMPKQTGKLTFTFVTDGITNAIAKAKKAAGDKNVTVIGGASTFQQCIHAGLCDEIEVGIVPVLLGAGLRLFEHIDTDYIQLEKMKVLDTAPDRTDMRFRVVKLA